jgi:phage-related minor tail protein
MTLTDSSCPCRQAGDRGSNPLGDVFGDVEQRTQSLERSTGKYAQTIAQAFTAAIASGKQFDSVLKSLVLRMSDMAVSSAMKPITNGIAGGLQKALEGLFGGGVKAFATGGVVGTPSYFPMASGIGLAGEAGPEAILPLARGSDGKLGVSAGSGGGQAPVTIHIATPDAESFRRSEAYITGQIARAVARGQRSL